ncbi:MAG: hypothetical protein N2050_02850 [Flavobacteriales bacterium]|nr:hypothetical protein [Flavobacteriales bacterium]
MKITHFSILPFAIALLSVGCKKKETLPKVTITVESPVPNAMFSGGDTVMIHAHITADKDIHGWALTISRVANNATVFDIHDHTHGRDYYIDTFWVNNVTMHSDMLLKLTAELDHDGNTESKTVNFHCHPM